MKKYKLKKLVKSEAKKEYKIKYELELNSAQLKTVETLKGPLLVIAGAGTGKTRTLIYRVARLVEEGINPENILLLTFTRKASQEMLKRASQILDNRCGKIAGGTFHSFGNLILRKYAQLIGFNNKFTILDRSDSEDVINIIRTNLGYNKKEVRFPKKNTILNIISKAINKSSSIEEILEQEYPHFTDNIIDIEKIKEEYVKYKKVRSIMDYDDLLIYLKLLLEEHNTVKSRLSNFYKYIMVDEYQDTNKLQADIVSLLASEHKNIMVVGDDSQSIYSFRGANFKNIIDFPSLFPDTKVITIEENYRSTQPVLDLTNEIIKYGREKYPKKLFTRREGEEKPVYIETESENYQSQFIVQKILELREEGVPLDDIAVLFRSAWHSNDLEIELTSHNIPFIKYGGFKFIETAHVKDILAHLKISVNPMDTISWFRVLLLIPKIGPKTAENITGEVVDNKKGIEFLKEHRHNKKKYESGIKELYTILQVLINKKIPLEDKVKSLLDYYIPVLKIKYDDYNKRFNDLDSLSKIIGRYDDLEKFLVDITLDPAELSHVDTEPSEKDREERLILSTIHSAKGLEWNSVFVIFLVDGFFPSAYSLESEEQVEEERRLLYVATTRAKENLYLIKPGLEGSSNYFSSYCGFSKISRFLEEGDILEKYVEKWILEDEE